MSFIQKDDMSQEDKDDIARLKRVLAEHGNPGNLVNLDMLGVNVNQKIDELNTAVLNLMQTLRNNGIVV